MRQTVPVRRRASRQAAAILAVLTLALIISTIASPRPVRAAAAPPAQVLTGPTTPVTAPIITTTPATAPKPTTATTRPTARTTVPVTTRPVASTVPHPVTPVTPAPVVPQPVVPAPRPAVTVPAATLPPAPTTTTTIAPIGGKLPTAPVTVPLQTRGSNAHVSPVFPILSGVGFALAFLIAGARLFVTRPGGRDRRPFGDSPA